MKKQQDLLEKFENLSFIELTPDWNESILQKVSKLKDKKSKRNINNLALLAIFNLNIVIFSSFYIKSQKKNSKKEMQEVANSLLITTNSSKY
jgi:hypothetical protein